MVLQSFIVCSVFWGQFLFITCKQRNKAVPRCTWRWAHLTPFNTCCVCVFLCVPACGWWQVFLGACVRAHVCIEVGLYICSWQLMFAMVVQIMANVPPLLLHTYCAPVLYISMILPFTSELWRTLYMTLDGLSWLFAIFNLWHLPQPFCNSTDMQWFMLVWLVYMFMSFM